MIPEQNLEIIRRIYSEGLLERPEQLLAILAPGVEYVNPSDAVEPGVRRGSADVGKAFANISKSFDSSRYELHELFSEGDTVVASVSFCARFGGSEGEVVQEEAHTWTLLGGRVTRFEWGRNLNAALEAAGLG